MHRRTILASLGVSAALAFLAASGGTAMAATTTPQTISWGNVLVTEGAHPIKIATLGPFHLTAQCTSTGLAEYYLKSGVAGFVYGEDGSGPEAMVPRKAYLISDDVDTDEAFYAYATRTGATIQGNTFRWTPSYLGGNQCEFQGAMTLTS